MNIYMDCQEKNFWSMLWKPEKAGMLRGIEIPLRWPEHRLHALYEQRVLCVMLKFLVMFSFSS